jgi:SAM-dependent methyltransferase
MTATAPSGLLTQHGDLIICPRCGGDLDVAPDGIACTSCAQHYELERGIPRLFWFHEGAGPDDVTDVVKAFYEETPFPNYDDVESPASLRSKVGRGNFARALDEALPADALVLEVGCGTGQLTNYLALDGRRVFGADLCVNSLGLAHGFASQHGLDNATFVHMNLFRPVFRPGSFDLVACNGVLHHTADPFGGFESIVSLVKDDGYVLVGLYNRYGRIMTNVRREVFRRGGERLRFLDPRLRSGRYAERKAVTWYRDQYDHPHESQHTIGEVLDWFDRCGLDFVSCYPSAHGESPEDLLGQQSRPTRADQARVQLQMALADREGGFFTLVGRKRPGAAAGTVAAPERRYRSPRPASDRRSGLLASAVFHTLGLAGKVSGSRSVSAAPEGASTWSPVPDDTDPYETF